MNDVMEQSRNFFDSGYYCAESVIRSIAGHYGADPDLLTKVATGFCAGVSRTSGMCGAVSGAIMAIGLIKGRTSPEQPVYPVYILVQRLLDSFAKEFGSINCGHLVGCDLNRPEGQTWFKENDLRSRCSNFTGQATRMALEIISRAD
jgi:C_GCAxxG_C_C family probable redox protein